MRLNVCLEDLFNLGLGGAVEASSKISQKADNLGIRVAFDRCISLINENKIIAESQ